MKLEIKSGVTTINAYEYRSRHDIEEVIIPDCVTVIKEGAFKDCIELQKITVGKGLRQISTYAFTGIRKNADIVWLSSISYKSMLITILPKFDVIRSLCAPYAFFGSAGHDEKRALACGYILHPELQQEYRIEKQEEYKKYILDELPKHLNELCENDSILDIFLQCRKRHLIRDKETMKQYIAYIRTRKIDRKEKKMIDQIEEEEQLQSDEAIKEGSDLDKMLLRYIRECTSQAQMRQVLTQEGLQEFPPVKYKDSIRIAPIEALKFIMYQYMIQWSYMNAKAPFFHYDASADHVAGFLDEASLQSALEQLISEIMQEELNHKIHIRYPRRLIAFFRYASHEQIEAYIQKRKEWSDYDIYGQEGLTAIAVMDHAILLNDDFEAMLFAYQNHMLSSYGTLRNKNENDLLIEIVDALEKRAPAEHNEELQSIQKAQIQKLYTQYLSDKSILKEDWYRWNMLYATLRSVASTLVWQREGEERCFFIMTSQGAVDENGARVSLRKQDRISVAHPVYMRDDQIRLFQKYLMEHRIEPCFPQIKTIKERYQSNEWEIWKNRYFGIRTSAGKLQELGKRGCTLDGRPSEYIRISFRGRVVMEAFCQKQPDEVHTMVLGDLHNSNYNIRELNEIISILDEVLCFEMITLGRLEAAPYLKRFNRDEIDELLAASIAVKHNENIAVLLEYKANLVKEQGDEDLLLNW